MKTKIMDKIPKKPIKNIWWKKQRFLIVVETEDGLKLWVGANCVKIVIDPRNKSSVEGIRLLSKTEMEKGYFDKNTDVIMMRKMTIYVDTEETKKNWEEKTAEIKRGIRKFTEEVVEKFLQGDFEKYYH